MVQTLDDINLEERPSRGGNEPDFADVFRKLERAIYRYLLRLTRNQMEAEDLTQETFIRVYQKLRTFRGESTLSTWVYRIATHVAIDHFRGSAACQDRVSQSIEEFDGEWIDANTPSLDHQVAQSEVSDCMQRFIQHLPLSYRAVLVLHDLQGLKTQDIADVLDCSLETVKIRLHRARNKLRRSLDAGCDLDHDEGNILVCEPNAASKFILG